MTPLLSLIFLILIAYIGAVFLQKTVHTPVLLKSIIHSGIVYLVIGCLIGPNFLSIVNNNILEKLSVLLAFVLGWTGFLIGLQINVRQMKRFQIKYYWLALGNFSVIFILILLGIYFINYIFNSYLDFWEILVITTAASIGSPLLLGIVKKEFSLRGKLIHFLQFHSAYDNMLAIIIIGVIIAGTGIQRQGSAIHTILSVSTSILITGILAVMFYYAVKNIKNVPQYFLIIMGFVLILVGMALHFNQSALFMAFIFGVILANLPLKTWKLFQTISNAEKPIYLLLLVFMGASLTKLSLTAILIAILFSIWRLMMKYISGRIIFVRFNQEDKFSRNVGLAGIGMGGISLAIGIDYHLSNVSVAAEFILLVIGLSFLLSDAFSLTILKQVINSDRKQTDII